MVSIAQSRRSKLSLQASACPSHARQFKVVRACREHVLDRKKWKTVLGRMDQPQGGDKGCAKLPKAWAQIQKDNTPYITSLSHEFAI